MTHGRKPRQARWIAGTDTMSLACRRVAKLSQAEIDEVLQPLQQAFKAFREGVATEWDWTLLASSINAAMAIEKLGVVRGLREHLHAAELCLAGIWRRAMETGAWRAPEPFTLELDAIETAVDLHKFQLENLSRGEVINAVTYAQAEVRSTGGQVLQAQRQQQLAGIE